MLRILIIGRESAAWADRLEARGGDQLELDTARLPAAGLRQFEATPPDALVVVDTSSSRRTATLIAAIRERPIGQLIPVIAIAPPPGDEDAAEVDAWLSPHTDVDGLAGALEESLGVELAPSQDAGAEHGSLDEATRPRSGRDDGQGYPSREQTTPSPSHPGGSGGADSPAYFIEEIDEPFDKPRRLKRESIFGSRAGRPHEQPSEQARVDEEAVKRKLRAVRHEDYYAILELRRGAEGAVVREAFHRLVRRFDAREIDFEVARRFEDELAEIHDALEDAWAVLGDPKLREAYLKHTTRG